MTISNEDLVRFYQNHEETQVIEYCKEEIVKNNEKFAWKIANKVHRDRGYELEDCFQICNIALLKAMDHYDASKGFKFLTFAARIMFFDIHAAHKKNKPTLSYDKAKEDYNLDIEDDSDPVSDVIVKELREKAFAYALTHFKGKTLELFIIMFSGEECTQYELAERLGMHQPNVSKLKSKIQKELARVILGD